jgi:hypothetical protein
MMQRREFLSRTSAGLVASMVLPGCWAVENKKAEAAVRPQSIAKSPLQFRDYRKGETLCPVQIITPPDAPYMHTFYDVSPFSPNGRYVVLSKLPYQYKNPPFGDEAEVCIIDLQEQTIRTIYSTKAWAHQLGTNAQWGNNNQYVYTNDWIEGEAVCVRIDIETVETQAFAGPMYHIAPDASAVVGFPPDIINATQMGYGVPENPDKPPYSYTGAPDDFGLFRTDLQTNERSLLVPLSKFKDEYAGEAFENSTTYFFHTKFNPQGDRIMQVVRCMVPGKNGWNPSLYTFDADGRNITKALGHQQWNQGGNHPNWHPDGRRIVMNLHPKKELGIETRCFVIFNEDGSDMKLLSKHTGGGHPSVTPDTKWLVTDAYTRQQEFVNDRGEVKIRLIDLVSDEEEAICYVYTPPLHIYGVLRNDPHPVWSRDFKKVLFCGTPAGKREIFIADLGAVL